jgi:alpha-N-arabinofuranosidase
MIINMKTPAMPPVPVIVFLLLCAFCYSLLQTPLTKAQSNLLTVEVDRPGAAIAPTMFGLFFEDINFGADGGLYPERVKNKSFEFPDPMMGWRHVAHGDARGVLQVFDAGARKEQANAHYLQIKVTSGSGGFGVTNDGFRGIGVEQGAEYNFSVKARNAGGTAAMLRVEVEDADGKK